VTYYHHTDEETEDYEPCTTVLNPKITKHCDLRSKGVGKWSCLRFGRGDFFLSGVCFALSEMGVEGAGGGIYRRAVCEVVLKGCGVVVIEQVTRGNKYDGGGDGVAGGNGGGGCAAKGAWGGGSAHGGRARVRGARVSGGVNDPDVCGLWFQETCLSVW
jgi:hypothetical protein